MEIPVSQGWALPRYGGRLLKNQSKAATFRELD